MKNQSDNWEYLDITLPLSTDLPFWPQSSGIRLEWVKTLDAGDHCNASVLYCDVHAGTHVDAPLHHLPNGADVTGLQIDSLCGLAWVTEIPDVYLIGPEELERCCIPVDCRRLLLRTNNSRLWRQAHQSGFFSDFTALSESGAQWIADRKLVLVGIDYLSVQPYHAESKVHTILFDAGTAVLEGIDLNGVEPGEWELICLPLRLVGAEGSPARAVLRKRRVNKNDD